MKTKVVTSIITRIGEAVPIQVVSDFIDDTIIEVKNYINYKEKEELPIGLKPMITELVMIKINKLGAEGLQSESHSGISQNYSVDMPDSIKRQIRRYRRLSR